MKKWNFLIILVFTLLYRLLPHPFNFTPVISCCLFAGLLGKRSNIHLFITILAIAGSDLILGLYPSLLFSYAAYLLIVVLAQFFNQNIKIKNILLLSIASSLIFFFLSNFGVWYIGNYYPANLSGLLTCLTAGIPFLQNTICSSLLFSTIFLYALKCINNLKNNPFTLNIIKK